MGRPPRACTAQWRVYTCEDSSITASAAQACTSSRELHPQYFFAGHDGGVRMSQAHSRNRRGSGEARERLRGRWEACCRLEVVWSASCCEAAIAMECEITVERDTGEILSDEIAI